jgi:hypothetical protein
MTAIDAVGLMAAFFILLFLGGLWADGKDRRDARKRNQP